MVILPRCLNAPGEAASSAPLSQRKISENNMEKKEIHIAITPELNVTSAGGESFLS